MITRISVFMSFVLVLATATAAIAQLGVNDVTYTVRGFSFEGPSEIPAGMTTITLQNTADRDDLQALVSLSGGRSLEDFFDAMERLFSGELSVIPEWIDFHGGTPIGANETRSYTVFLRPGTYYLLSIEGDEEGPFAARGMLLPIEATAPAIAADVSVTLQDYEFVVDGTFRAGDQMVRVHNAANQPHEMLIFPLPPGMTLEDMFAPPPEGEHDEHAEEPDGPPAAAIQGIWAIGPGETVYVNVPLEPGTYGIVCFIPDADGPHAMQGMVLEIEVE